MTEEQQLWQDFKMGDKASYEAIYRSHINFLAAYGKSLCKEVVIVEDCIQELFVDLWRTKANLGDTTSIRNYLLVSLRHKIVKELQHKNSGDEFVDLASPDENIQDKMMDVELSDRTKILLNKALENLTRQQREAVNLRFYQEKNYEEISTIMGINYQSCRNLISQAIKNLQKSDGLLKITA